MIIETCDTAKYLFLSNKYSFEENLFTCSVCNKEEIITQRQIFKRSSFFICKSCNREKSKVWRANNPEEHKKRLTDWRANNPEYYVKKREADPVYKLACTLRSRLNSAFKSASWKKGGSTEQLLGCSFDEAKTHLENKFTEGMSWNNRSEWHIDHIYPLSKAKDEEHMKELCHYKNLQPLWAYDNISKGNKIISQ